MCPGLRGINQIQKERRGEERRGEERRGEERRGEERGERGGEERERRGEERRGEERRGEERRGEERRGEEREERRGERGEEIRLSFSVSECAKLSENQRLALKYLARAIFWYPPVFPGEIQSEFSLQLGGPDQGTGSSKPKSPATRTPPIRKRIFITTVIIVQPFILLAFSASGLILFYIAFEATLVPALILIAQ
ncbi:hypothetical protein DUI87_28003 [Hirundo rustica rustica]|uniref:Uncharacterized protein n=1 Tax=Hirundo rustica rustica TaxID=333673 RepID=A0A3M0JAP3_HIRRU|nr:hypothetical protein DUI87_28003 [Hirundo rustica rustica]